jgi:riboflavin synthase alpha subunit
MRDEKGFVTELAVVDIPWKKANRKIRRSLAKNKQKTKETEERDYMRVMGYCLTLSLRVRCK